MVLTDGGEVAAYALMWNDPTTGVGFVEPVGTASEHRRLGLARAIVSEGLSALADAGARRIKVNYDGGNDAARRLYISLGFLPTMTTSLWVRRPTMSRTYG